MAAKNTWEVWPDNTTCRIEQPSGLQGVVIFDHDGAKLVKERLTGRLQLMQEPSGRVYCMGRFNSGATVPVHRWLMQISDKRVVHHINNDSLDNRARNLEVTSQSKNLRERQGWGKHGYKGVYQDRCGGKFHVSVTAYGFDTPEEAADVANAMRAARDALLDSA